MTKLELEMTNNELEARVIELEAVHVADAHLLQVKYRRVPEMTLPKGGRWVASTQDRTYECDERSGHVLVMDHKGIHCTLCPAEWRDYNF